MRGPILRSADRRLDEPMAAQDSQSRGVHTVDLVDHVIRRVFPGRIAVVSSFGAEAAVLLHVVSCVAPATPVVFVDTGKLFDATLRYRDRLAALLGLTDVRTVTPRSDRQATVDGDGDGELSRQSADHCCGVRKVEPLRAALAGFEAWITGRKRLHGAERAALPTFELGADGTFRIHPLAHWSHTDISAYFRRHALPRHPLVAKGYRSIGCAPCTDRVARNEAARAGRWRGLAKTECGIHGLRVPDL